MDLKSDIFVIVPTVLERAQYSMPLMSRLKGLFSDNVFLYDDIDRSLIHSHPKSWLLGKEKGLLWTGVAEDDIILSDDFSARLPAVLDDAIEKNRMVVNLYSNYSEDLIELKKGATGRFHKGSQFRNEQFLIMRTELLFEFENFYRALDLSQYKRGWSDVILSEFFVAYGLDVWIVLPNLVDHRNEKSTLGYPRKVGGIERKSRTFGMTSPSSSEVLRNEL